MIKEQRFITALLRLLWRYPKLLFVVLLLGGLDYSYEVFYARNSMSFMGIPQAKDAHIEHWTRIFRNDAYMVGYSDLKANPLWVVYRLSAQNEDRYSLKRPDTFQRDWRLFWLIGPEEYTHSGYDRGHMAPNDAIASQYGANAQVETFLMSNVTPQKPSLNQKIWKRLEKMEQETFLKKVSTLWVYTGPLFEGKTQYLRHSYVEIPTAFYKVYVGIDAQNHLHALAVILPQNAQENDAIERYIVSIDEVERRSGFDLFKQLDDAVAKKLEATIETSFWLQ